MEIISGDQLVISVDFTIDGQPATFVNNTAEFVIHMGQQDITIQPVEYDKGTATFYLSASDTAELLNKKHDGKLKYSVRFYFDNDPEQRETPIHRKDLTVKR